MPIGISDVVTYHFIGPVWVILCFVITVLYNDVPMGTYCSVSRFPLFISIGRCRHKASVIYIYIYIELITRA